MSTWRIWLAARLRAWLLRTPVRDEIRMAVCRAHGWDDQPAGAAMTWRAVPVAGSQRIELVAAEPSACGFYIVFDPTDLERLYRLYDPEGRSMAYGQNLPGLKHLGERFARERAEFVPRPIHRDHWRH